MPLGSVANVILDADFTGKTAMKRAKRQIDDVKDELNKLATANSTTASATRNNTAAQSELAGGLTGLQAQLASTRAAQEALEDETVDLNDVFDDFDDTTSNIVLDTLAENFEDISDNLDDIGLGEFDDELNNLNSHELRDIMRYTAGIDDNLGMIENRSLGATADEITELFETTLAVDSRDQADLFDVLFGDSDEKFDMRVSEALGDIWSMTQEEALELDQAEIAELLEGPLDPEEVHSVIQSEFGGGSTIRDEDISALSSEFSPYGENTFDAREFFQAPDSRIRSTFGRDVDVEAVREDLLDTIFAMGGLSEPMSALSGRSSSEFTGPGVPSELLEAFDDDESLSRLLTMDDVTLGRIMDRQMGPDRGGLTTSDVRQGVMLQLQHLGEAAGLETDLEALRGGSGSRDLSALRRQLDMPEPRDRSSIADSEMVGPIADLQRLISNNADFAEIARESSGFEEFVDSIVDLEGDDMAEFVQTLRNDQDTLSDGFNNLLRSTDEVTDSFDSMADVADSIDKQFAGTLSDLQTEILARIAGDMDATIPQKRAGTNVPMSYEALELELFQELLDSDSDTRRNSIQGILQQLYSGKLGQIGTDFETLLSNDTFRNQDLRPTVRSSLPGNFTDEDVDAIMQEFADSNVPITHMLGDDPRRSVDNEIIGPALRDRRSQIGPDAISDATRAVEDAMRDALYGPGSQSAPGVLQTLRARDDMDLEDLLPGEEVLTGSLGEERRQRAAAEHTADLGDAIDKLRETQMDFMPGLGATGGELDGSRRQRRGLFGMALQQASGALASLDALGDDDGGLLGGRSLDTSRNVRRLSSAFQGLRSTLDILSPMIDLTSINLGPLNARFESAIGMVTKLTALLGPLIVGVAGVAGAAISAAGALGALVAVGAVEYLGMMEDRMAGVSDKQEAMEELMGTLRDLAFEALRPLREVELADGRDAMQLFVDTIRGGLVFLNNMANVIAQIVAMPVFSEQLQRLSELFTGDPRGSGVMENLREATRDALPIVAGLIEYIVENLDDFAVFAGEVMQILAGGEFTSMRDSLASIAQVAGVVIKFGAALINTTVVLLGVFAKLISVVFGVLDAFVSIANVIPGVSVGIEDVATALGRVVGTIAVLAPAIGSLLLYFTKGAGAISYVAKAAGYLLVPLKALVALVSGALGVSTGWAAALVGLAAVLADFVYYLVTGESAASNFLRTLEEWTGMDVFGGVAEDIENIYKWLQKTLGAIPSVIRGLDNLPGYQIMGPSAAGGLIAQSAYVSGGGGGSAGGSGSTTNSMSGGITDTAMGAAASTIQIQVDASRSDRDLARRIQKEFKRLVGDQYGN
jgi:hypothetical protein